MIERKKRKKITKGRWIRDAKKRSLAVLLFDS